MTANKSLAYITILFSAFFLFFSLRLPFGNLNNIGPGGWPSVILGLLLIMGVILLAKSIYLERHEKKVIANQNNEEEQIIEVADNTSKKHLVLAFMLLIYIMGIKYIGFLLATPLFIGILAFTLGMKNWIRLLLTSIIGTAFFIYLFAVLLRIPFPRGIGFFREWSLLFY
ncbi:tripartite tricarboxylate transporter TctB family protein [Sporosarcina newyorkensis]|uniref:Tripartite tricarboxylate transporter TctB family protein n=1 Tax=Sporosarcina newyorkensis TaxID=759851 RepID=A0A1T4Y9N5_9BACL|nr:tripartite tricarboxylate transporter TctB family protein [Sporosarcina newyorkensis]SKA97985.1 Tripartite tricarboxylate transporter TctB family protein [Sporosarcina newyorkensis]